jgi:hypothetical protein
MFVSDADDDEVKANSRCQVKSRYQSSEIHVLLFAQAQWAKNKRLVIQDHAFKRAIVFSQQVRPHRTPRQEMSVSFFCLCNRCTSMVDLSFYWSTMASPRPGAAHL